MKKFLAGIYRAIVPVGLRETIRIVRCAQKLSPQKRTKAVEILQSGLGLQKEPFQFLEDGLATIHNADFLSDPAFVRAYELGKATGSWAGWELRWRAYVICWVAKRACKLEGDFVECGVNRGGNARMIIDYIGADKFDRASFFLLDTFEGFDATLLLPEEKSIPAGYNYPNCLADVRKTFEPFPFIKIVPGAVPATLDQASPEKVAFLSIDMNCVAPEIAAAHHYWPRLSRGAIVVLDDYGFSRHSQQKKAFDDFCREVGTEVLALPTGQGLIFKP